MPWQNDTYPYRPPYPMPYDPRPYDPRLLASRGMAQNPFPPYETDCVPTHPNRGMYWTSPPYDPTVPVPPTSLTMNRSPIPDQLSPNDFGPPSELARRPQEQNLNLPPINKTYSTIIASAKMLVSIEKELRSSDNPDRKKEMSETGMRIFFYMIGLMEASGIQMTSGAISIVEYGNIGEKNSAGTTRGERGACEDFVDELEDFLNSLNRGERGAEIGRLIDKGGKCYKSLLPW